MKWLIYGHNGWIGHQVLEHINENYPNDEVILGKSRVDNNDEVLAELLNSNPDRVVCLIGRTHGDGISTIDYLENKGKLVINIRDNLYGPLVLAINCQKLNIHLTYLGTGCIFNYDETHTISNNNGFKESDIPNFFGSSYSVVKGYTDRLMHLFSDNVLNIRIRMPITSADHSRNFISKIIRYEKICSIENSMTVLDELIPCMILMAKEGETGTVNMTNPGKISHNQILELYKKQVDPSFSYKNFSIDEQQQILKSDRSNNYLDTSRLENRFPFVQNIENAIIRVLSNWKKT